MAITTPSLRNFTLIVSPTKKIYFVDRNQETVLGSYFNVNDDIEKVYDFRRDQNISDYMYAKVNDARKVVLCHHQNGGSKVIPWTDFDEMKMYVTAYFGYGSHVDLDKRNICLDMSGKLTNTLSPHLSIDIKNFKISTSRWQLSFSHYEAKFNRGIDQVPVHIYHTYDLVAFQDVCSILKIRHVNEVESDIWIYSNESIRIEEATLDQNNNIYLGFFGESKVVIKKYPRKYIFLPTYMRILTHQDNNHIRRFRGLHAMGDGYGLIFDYYEKSLHDFIVQNQKEGIACWFDVFRDIVIGLIFIRRLKICHNNLNPWNILLTKSNVPKISGFTKAVELTDTTSRSDLIALGKLIAFSYSAKIHIFEERYKDYSPDTNRKFMYTWACEAEDVSMRLLNPSDKMSIEEILSHPWFWTPETRISFINDAHQLLSSPGLKLDHKMLQQVSEFYRQTDWTTEIPFEVLDHMRSYASKYNSGNPSGGSNSSGIPSSGYEGSNPRHLLKFVRNFISHLNEILTCLPNHLNLGDTYGYTPADVELALRLKFPRLQLGVFKFLQTNNVVTGSVVEGHGKMKKVHHDDPMKDEFPSRIQASSSISVER